jgi:predicted Holliday junction resolvase-like endonuclease
MEEILRTCIVILFLVIIPVGIVSLLYKIISIKRDIKREKREWDEYLKEIELGH